MKSYTDIKQSKKLLQSGLNPDTADMCWGLDAESGMYNNHPYPMPWKDYTAKSFYIPCWSLAALLGVMPSGNILINDVKSNRYKIICSLIDSEFHDNPIDACVEMLFKLHKQKLL